MIFCYAYILLSIYLSICISVCVMYIDNDTSKYIDIYIERQIQTDLIRYLD